MPDAEDPYAIAFEREQHAVIAEAQPERTGHVTVERHDLPATRPGEMEEALEDAHSCGLVQSPNVRLGFLKPFNPIRRHLLVQRNVFRLKPELGENLFHRNALTPALCEPFLSVKNPAPVLRCYGLIIGRRAGDCARYWVEHRFQQTANRRNLAWSEPVY